MKTKSFVEKKIEKRKLTNEEDIILDCWYQFAYQGGKNGKRKWSGGLSTLEHAENYLMSKGIINSWGNKRPEIIW